MLFFSLNPVNVVRTFKNKNQTKKPLNQVIEQENSFKSKHEMNVLVLTLDISRKAEELK